MGAYVEAVKEELGEESEVESPSESGKKRKGGWPQKASSQVAERTGISQISISEAQLRRDELTS